MFATATSVVLAVGLPTRVRADDAATVQDLIEAGHRSSDAGRFCEAFSLYHRAADTAPAPSPGVLFVLGRAAFKAGIWDQAIVALTAFLGSATDDRAAKDLAGAWLKEARLHVVECAIVGDDAMTPAAAVLQARASAPQTSDAEVCSYDARSVLIEGSAAVFNAGWTYEVAGQCSGIRLRTQTMRVPVGAGAADANDQTRSCQLQLQREPSEPSVQQPKAAEHPNLTVQTQQAPPQPTPRAAFSAPPTFSYVAWGVAVAALAGMTVALVERESQVKQWNSSACLSGGKTRQENCAAIYDDYKSSEAWALGAGIGALAFGALGGALWLFDKSPERPATAWSCQLSVSAAARCTMRF
jgi:hypothetical protein